MRRFADTMAWARDRGGFAIDAAVDERLGFIRRTYGHLLGELLGVSLVTWLTLHTPALLAVATLLLSNLLLYFAAFFGVSLISRKLMEGDRSTAVQYAGAGLWVFFLGLLVAPIAMICERRFGDYAILGEAFILTASVFSGLTAYVFFTRKDFTWMRGALAVASWLLVGIGVIQVFFGGFSGSPIYSILVVILMAGWVLHDTSNVLHHRRIGQHVAASVDLLVDFVYMFIHIAIILMSSRD